MYNKQKEKRISLSDFKEFLFSKIVPLNELLDRNGDPLQNIFPYWRRHKLLPFVPKGKWIKVSFAQLIWIRILDTLRSFGYPLTSTQKVCDYFFKDAYDNNLPEKNLKANKENLNKKKLAGTISDEEQAMLDCLSETEKDKTLLYILKYDINYLTNLITDSIVSSEEAAILVFSDGNVYEKIGSHYFSHRENEYGISDPHIYLSINYFLNEFIDDKELSRLILPQLTNDDELKVLKEIRNKNIQEIVITKKGGEIIKLESSKSGNISGEQAQEIKKILGLNNYEQIKLSTRDEKTLSFKRTKRK